MKRNNIVFLLMLFLIFCIVITTFFVRKNYYSIIENRDLKQFPNISFETYLNGEYQSNLENALSDQFIGSEWIRTNLYKSFDFSSKLKLKNDICHNHYFSIDGYYAIYDCNDSIVTYPQNLYYNNMQLIDDSIKMYNELNDYIDTYYYFISSPLIFDFETNTYSIDVKDIISEKMTGNYTIDYLQFSNYNEYINYFYKNDHHWNYKGSYKGYRSIIEMLKPNDDILTPIDEITFDDIYFYGSNARMTRIFDYKEKFTVYKYSVPAHTVLCNKIECNYGHQDEYFNGYYDRNIFTHHYSEFYGLSIGEIVFDFNNNEDNLLILSNSYINPINRLIASHFNKTYVVDLRYYKDELNEEFHIKKYIEDNDIDKVLVVMDYYYFTSIDSNIGMEN